MGRRRVRILRAGARHSVEPAARLDIFRLSIQQGDRSGDHLISSNGSRRHPARRQLILAASLAGRHGLFMAGQSAWRDGSGSVFPAAVRGPIAFFDLVALFSPHSLPHWSMSGFLFAFRSLELVQPTSSDRRRWLTASFLAAAVRPASGNELCRAGKDSSLHQAVLRTRTEIRCELAAHRLVCTERHARDPEITGDHSFVVAANWMQAHVFLMHLVRRSDSGPSRRSPPLSFLEDKRVNNRNQGSLWVPPVSVRKPLKGEPIAMLSAVTS